MQDGRDLYGMIQERVRLLADDEKAEETEYRRRLSLCGACVELNSGICAQCGCYVEIRAAKRGMRCPHIVPKW